jgi:hypothetical protein
MAKPTTDRIVSRTVHVLRVSLTDMLKYIATIQQPPSLTWLAMIEPTDIGPRPRTTSRRHRPRIIIANLKEL